MEDPPKLQPIFQNLFILQVLMALIEYDNSFEKKVSLKQINPIFLPLVRCLA